MPMPDDLDRLISLAFVQTDPIDASAEVVMTLRAIARRAHRLAPETPPGLAWRHERTGQALDALLVDLWPLED